MASQGQATRLLNAMCSGDHAAAEQVLPLIYDELRDLADRHLNHERVDHTLQPTALAHEAYLRLVDQSRTTWASRAQFLSLASEMIRRILVDHARARRRQKRGRGVRPVELRDAVDDDQPSLVDLLDLDEALTELGERHERQQRIVELRYFGGLTIEETARVLDASPTTIKAEWRMARAWLSRRLSEP